LSTADWHVCSNFK